MGIRFLCPNGHKLNVKAYLAGKRGLCPECGVKVLIPSESTLPGNKPPPADPSVVVPVDGQLPATPPAPIALADSTPLHNSTEPASSNADQPELDLMIFEELDFSALEATPTGPKKPPPLRRSLEQPKAAAEKATLEIVWYVRLPSGGQFGPATSDVIQAWIQEGRVSSDSLVWREGWRDWQLLADAFPPVATEEAPNPLRAVASRQPPQLPKATAAGRRPPKRASENYRTLAIVLLIIIALILSGVLIWVLIKGSASAPAPDASGPPVSSIACQAWRLGSLPPAMHLERTR